MNLKRFLLAATLACAAAGAANADDELKAALSNPARSAASISRDAARHPYETLTFFGITPSMTVVELSPGAGWYTEILAPYLREHGKLIEAGNDPKSPNAGARGAAARFQQKLDSNPAAYGKVQLGVFEPPRSYQFAPKGSVDMVLTFRNLHNWLPIGDEGLKTLMTAIYDSLKPGGVLGFVEHRLPAALTQDTTASSGYIHQAYVVKLVESVGFKLAASSEVNANPKDTTVHKGGVWALPPTYTNGDEDRASYTEIGESDRMTLKFVKP